MYNSQATQHYPITGSGLATSSTHNDPMTEMIHGHMETDPRIPDPPYDGPQIEASPEGSPYVKADHDDYEEDLADDQEKAAAEAKYQARALSIASNTKSWTGYSKAAPLDLIDALNVSNVRSALDDQIPDAPQMTLTKEE